MSQASTLQLIAEDLSGLAGTALQEMGIPSGMGFFPGSTQAIPIRALQALPWVRRLIAKSRMYKMAFYLRQAERNMATTNDAATKAKERDVVNRAWAEIQRLQRTYSIRLDNQDTP